MGMRAETQIVRLASALLMLVDVERPLLPLYIPAGSILLTCSVNNGLGVDTGALFWLTQIQTNLPSIAPVFGLHCPQLESCRLPHPCSDTILKSVICISS